MNVLSNWCDTCDTMLTCIESQGYIFTILELQKLRVPPYNPLSRKLELGSGFLGGTVNNDAEISSKRKSNTPSLAPQAIVIQLLS